MEKLCTIVGIGPGMGLAIAQKFAGEGFNIAQIARRKEALHQYQTKLAKEGAKVYSYPTDVSDFKALSATFDKIEKEAGQTDLLIFNVSVLNPANPSDLKVDDLVHQFKVNVGAALVCAQKVIPFMKEKQMGKIFLTGGGLALKPYYEYASLSVGKAAMRSLSISLSQELQQYGIHVATITIDGMVEPGTHFDPDTIAEVYWRLYNEEQGKQELEVIYN